MVRRWRVKRNEPYIDDPDFQLFVGDALEVLQGMPAESVHCCVTSPPYFGLRDYGTGTWDGGDAECDHKMPATGGNPEQGPNKGNNNFEAMPFKDVCGKCGATRVDQQLGLEPTPDQYVASMVNVFREVKRVLRSDGTLFLNIGDSYASSALPMQRVRNDDSGTRSGEGDVREVLPPNGAPTLERSQPGTRAREGADLSPYAQGAAEREHHPTSTGYAKPDSRDARIEVPVLRGDGAGVPDDRPRPERREQGQEDGSTPALQDDSGRGLSDGPLPNPLLELQLGEAPPGDLSPYGALKQKDLVGIPWMLAFALRADGWYLRADIIWAKSNPMPESVTDRPTKAHEYLFLLTKSSRYFYDADAIREPFNPDGRAVTHVEGRNGSVQHRNGERWPERPQQVRARELFAQAGLTEDHLAAIRAVGTTDVGKAKITQSGSGHNTPEMQRLADEAKAALGGYYREFLTPTSGRNKRSVWEIATEAYPDAHFATFPQALVEPCVKAGCPEWVCGTCGKARERITDVTYVKGYRSGHLGRGRSDAKNPEPADMSKYPALDKRVETVGWTDCGHNNYQPGLVLDPFLGSGTTAQVARRLGRRCVGIELNPAYAQLAARRLQQQSLFA